MEPGPDALDSEAYLTAQQSKGQLRFLTCGSVDDGKSTLLGRLLFDSKSVFDDQISAAGIESRTYGTQGDDIDLALLVDGLQAEREQGITIDVAYRFLETDQRKFIAADAPGHEQYTRNMATAASTADLVVVLVDARKGVLTQTKRHSFIASMLGIQRIVLAVNKMDLVDYGQAVFEAVVADYRAFAGELGLDRVVAIPMSALTGDNVFAARGKMPWYRGPTLMAHLDTVDVETDVLDRPFRLPVQSVSRPNSEFRGYCGLIASGAVEVGQGVASSLTGRKTVVTSIHGPSEAVRRAVAGQSVTLTLADDMDISRGDVLAPVEAMPTPADQFAAHLIWMDEAPLLPGRDYGIRFATASATAKVTELSHRLDVNTLAEQPAKVLDLNDVGYCKISVDCAIAFDAYSDNRTTGGFVLIDLFSNKTVGAGMIRFALRRASNIRWHDMKIDKQARIDMSGHKPAVVWFTGLSGSGKSTVANLVEQRLHQLGKRSYLLDGDNMRHGLNKDLGFTDTDRVENIRRAAEVARLMADAGLIVLASFISPFRSERAMARSLVPDVEFLEVHVSTPLEICEQRDPKDLYKKARAGTLKNFTGIDSPYEPPETPDIVLDGGRFTAEELADQLLGELVVRL